MRLLLALSLVVGSAACGGGGSGQSRSSTSSRGQSGETTAPSATSALAGHALSAAALERLVVAPSAPFAQLPDSALKTGLMEVGNPASGQIGIGFASQQEIVAVGFQRGWEKAFQAPDGAIVDINLFEFRSSTAPNALFATFESRAPKGYARLDIPGLTHASGFFGTSPEGRAAYGTAFADARFLVAVVVGGPPHALDYRALIVTLTETQFAQLKATVR